MSVLVILVVASIVLLLVPCLAEMMTNLADSKALISHSRNSKTVTSHIEEEWRR